MTKAPATPTRRRVRATDDAGAAKVGRREEILAIAASIFARKGFAATTVRDIAAEAGILSGSLYHHFSSKDELFEEILRTAVDRDIELDVAMSQASDVDAREALATMVTRMLRSMAAHPDVARLLANRGEAGSGTVGAAILRRRSEAIRTAMTTIISRGVQDGVFRPDLDVDLAFRMVVSSVDGVGRWYQPQGPRTIDELAAGLVRMLLDGLGATS